MAHRRGRPAPLPPLSPDETAYCGYAGAVRRSPACWNAADAEDETGDGAGGDKATTIGCSECEDQLAGKRAQRYCSVPPRPNPPPCQPCIPGTRNLQIDQNSQRTALTEDRESARARRPPPRIPIMRRGCNSGAGTTRASIFSSLSRPTSIQRNNILAPEAARESRVIIRASATRAPRKTAGASPSGRRTRRRLPLVFRSPPYAEGGKQGDREADDTHKQDAN